MAALIRFAAAAFVTGILAYGFFDYLTNFEANQCEMTWMFEMPEYIPISLGDHYDRKLYPRYRLFMYGEGKQANALRSSGPDGLPVLFIPGNAGSYKQVRSLASVALRMGEGKPSGLQLNFFTIDFNEELSGLYGGTLNDQIEYVDQCMRVILEMYPSTREVILVGHSMGGVIARAIIAERPYWKLGTIFTFASPHQAPVVTLDSMLYDLYNNINNKLRQNTRKAEMSIVSIGGGFRDVLVPQGLTSLDWVANENRTLSISTTSIPKAWVSTDHLCAVWCRQVVKATVRALFDLVHEDNGHMYSQVQSQMKILKHHFVANPGIEKFPKKKPATLIRLLDKVKWMEHTEMFWNYTVERVPQAMYIATPLPTEDMGLDAFTVLSNITSEQWVCACTPSKDTGRCDTCEDLSLLGKMVPPLYSNKKYLQIAVEKLQPHTHLLVLLPKVKHRVEIFVDFYDRSQRHLLFHLPGLWDLLLSYPVYLMGSNSAVLNIRNGSLYHSLHLGGLTHPLRTFHAAVVPRRCQKIDAGYYEGNLLSLDVPWSHEGSYRFSRFGETTEVKLKLHTAQPKRSMTDDAVHLEMFLHPACSYQLRIHFSTKDFLGQLVRIFGPLLPSAFVATILMALRGQIFQQLQADEDNRPFSAVWNRAKPFFLMPAVMVARFILGSGVVSRISARLDMVVEDSVPLQRSGLWFNMLPLLLALLAFFITYLYVSLTFWWTSLLSFPVCWLTSWIPGFVKERAWLLETAWCAGAAGLAVFVCGSLSLFPLYLLLLCKALHACRQKARSGSAEDQCRFNFLFLLMLLVLWQFALSSPQFFVWARNLRDGYAWSLSPDPSAVTSAVTILAALVVSNSDPLYPRTMALGVGWSLYGVAVVMLLFALTSLYRIAYLTTLTWLILAVPPVSQRIVLMLNPPKTKVQ